MGESDSDDLDSDDSDSEEENEKSVILNDDCQSDLNKDAEGSSDSVNFGKHGYGSGEASSESGSEEEKNVAVQETMELVGSSSEKALCSEQFDEVEINDQTTQGAVVRSSEAEAVAVAVSADQEDEAVEQGAHGVEITNIEDVAANPQDISVPNNGEIVEDLSSLPEPNGSPVSKLSDRKETSASKINSSAPLNFEDFSSAADMEV